jgi:hypothetical protein
MAEQQPVALVFTPPGLKLGTIDYKDARSRRLRAPFFDYHF